MNVGIFFCGLLYLTVGVVEEFCNKGGIYRYIYECMCIFFVK
jgi:hypothetical protein